MSPNIARGVGRGPEKCARCGMVAVGYARINDDRYCHGDDQRPSCYELTTREMSSARVHDLFAVNPDGRVHAARCTPTYCPAGCPCFCHSRLRSGGAA